MESDFIVDDNGVKRNATKIAMISIGENKYLIYSLNNDNMCDIYASRVIKDENNNDKLIKISKGEDKEKIEMFIKSLSQEYAN